MDTSGSTLGCTSLTSVKKLVIQLHKVNKASKTYGFFQKLFKSYPSLCSMSIHKYNLFKGKHHNLIIKTF